MIGADYNGHLGEGNRGSEVVLGRYGFKDKCAEGQMLVDFAKIMGTALVNSYFEKGDV